MRTPDKVRNAFAGGNLDVLQIVPRNALYANGAPGLRPAYSEDYYAAFVIDPDGYAIEAVINRTA